jgi:SNF2 family DNA or RNA helicase
MATFDDIQQGASVAGLAGSERVTVVSVCRQGDFAATVVFRTRDGALQERIVYEQDLQNLEVQGAAACTFRASAEDFALASEARRMSLAHLFDPYLAVHTSNVEPLPHQISAVYEEMLPRIPLRYVLADDPGAGKTIMTGLLVKEMLARGDLRRCLIVCPGSLVEQWQDELLEKFGLAFTIVTNDLLESSATRNAFAETDLAIARLDKLARSDEAQALLRQTSWDLVVCDEAHKMSATMGAEGPHTTRRFRLGRLLGTLTPNILLLTATPHNGKPKDFQLFMSLVDQDQFEGAVRSDGQTIDVQGSMRRLVKEELLRFDGTPLFPERRAYTVRYELSPAEQGLYDAVTEYVTCEFNRADALDGKRRSSVGFALTSLQRRLASSPEAVYRSLRRRRERLSKRLAEAEAQLAAGASSGAGAPSGAPSAADAYLLRPEPPAPGRWPSDDFDEDDWAPGDAASPEDDVLDAATAAATADELRAEIQTLARLEDRAAQVRASGTDRKWDELSRILQDDALLRDAAGGRLKLIVFTEHRDTLDYLVGKVSSLLGSGRAVVAISGSMGRDERRLAQDRFRQDPEACVLVATDAAGEGVNLQCAHLMVNYDLPWNPNRLEQRFGRIHRIGQTEVCHLWNLVAENTREGDVYARLLAKLGEERGALNGKVFDVLGSVSFGEKPLRDLLVEAVRYGDDPAVRARLHQVVDAAFDPARLQELLDSRSLTGEHLGTAKVAQIRAEMDRLAARRLQPHYVGRFVRTALESLGGRLVEREPGRWQVRRVPACVRASAAGRGRVLEEYRRVCFDRGLAQPDGLPQADLVCPGHPLFDALVDAALRRYGGALEEGAVFVDPLDEGERPRLLASVHDAVVDGRGHRVYEGVQALSVAPDGSVRDEGPAPYLDWRAPTGAELEAVRAYLAERDPFGGVDPRAVAEGYAVRELVPRHVAFQRARRNERLDKVERNVRERLDAEVRYWDRKALDCADQARRGKPNAELNRANAERRAAELSERKARRLAELADERTLYPHAPQVDGLALVVPQGLLDRLAGRPSTPDDLAASRRAVELAAMEAVMAIERELGHDPRDVSAQNLGYDVESAVPPAADGRLSPMRFIEVKGRAAGADSVTVTCNEAFCALNNPEQYLLAVVEVAPDRTRTCYLRRPRLDSPSGASNNANYDIARLRSLSQVELERERTR